MKNRGGLRRALLALKNYFIFFASMCFVITCCMMLFLSILSCESGMELQAEQIRPAAALTFLNVILLSLAFTAIDAVRRRFTVERPVRQIVYALEKVIAGDFSVRIKRLPGGSTGESLNDVIECVNEMTEELSKTETLRTDFISNVSHELKTPLAVMQNYATLLCGDGLSDDRRREYAKNIKDASRRLASMVSNILRLNKLENQSIYPETKTFNLSEQLCECILGFESALEDKSISLETDLKENVPVTADPELLSLVWNNLLSNAIKFTDSGGTVSVFLEEDGESISVTVKDTGCGISPEVGRHIFERFYQGDPSHSTQGNGLGLALVRRVVDILHADIFVKSEVGRGSTFTVRLRRESDEAA